MAKFTRKETIVAGILLSLVHLIPRYHRPIAKLAFPTWNAKKKRCSTRRSRFAGINHPSICNSKSLLFPKKAAFTPSPDSPLVFYQENSSKCRNNGIPMDLNKIPDDLEPCDLNRGFKDEIFMDKERNSENGVPLDGECCKKRKIDESMITYGKKKNKKSNSENENLLDGECCRKRNREESPMITSREEEEELRTGIQRMEFLLMGNVAGRRRRRRRRGIQ